jgi:hypothetical protein
METTIKNCMYVVPAVPIVTVQSHVLEDSAGLAEMAGHPKLKIEEVTTDSPLIPQTVYDNLPNILKECSDQFGNNREKDVFLTGAITILSGCLLSISGLYNGDKVFSPAYSFIVAPAGSGKGVLKYAKKLGNAIHEQVFKNNGAVLTGDSVPKLLFIPGNCSSAAMLSQLKATNGIGIICETEADTINNSLKQDWGNYSDSFRKGFHHETISSVRKTENEYIEIQNPRIAVALSGTPAQVRGLIPSAEDGLFSRFIFYSYEEYQEFRNPFPVDENNLGDYFDLKSKEVLKISEFINDYPCHFKLSEKQKQEFAKYFKERQKVICSEHSDEASSIIMRMGLITFRIAMVLSAVRKEEDNDQSNENVCNDVDFETAMLLSDTYLKHSIQMFGKLPKTCNINNSKMNELLENMMDSKEMTRAEIGAIGKRIGIPDRTVTDYLKKAVESGIITKLRHGKYMKG